MKFLVTGGAGFIGSNIVEALLADGNQVRVLDNFSTGFRENIEPFLGEIELINGDIRDYWTVVQAVDGMDFVCHQAALASVPRSVANPLSSTEANINGTLHILEAAKNAGVKKFVMASSSSVYGESETLPKHEAMMPAPMSPYAITKLTNEYYCNNYYTLYGFKTVTLRYFNIFGPKQDPNGEYAAVIPKFIDALLTGRKPIVFGDGEQSRDFTYIENAVNANLLALTSDKIVGDHFNVACGDRFTLNELLTALGEIMGVDASAQYDPPRQGDILHSYASIDKLAAFGYKPTVQFKDGLARTVEFFRDKTQRAAVRS